MGRNGFIELTLPRCRSSLKEVRTGTQEGQEAGADAEAIEGCFLLAFLLLGIPYEEQAAHLLDSCNGPWTYACMLFG